MDEGPCEKIHSEALKLAFEKSKDPYAYDAVVERHFTTRIAEADRVIKASLQCIFGVILSYARLFWSSFISPIMGHICDI